MIPGRVTLLRQQHGRFPINTRLDPHLKRELRPGFLLPYLFELDARIFGCWDYWMEVLGKAKRL